ncbi:MAG TPA: type VI secretion system tube protein Hcp [Saprospiraceae bacterium]|nr:type VI secretion system tube protein Hcp [Saprospiraceae bacterium]
MKIHTPLMIFTLLYFPLFVFSQNKVGIGTPTPSEKLEVAGVIYSNLGGIRFPDETLQETAAFSSADPGDGATGKLRPYMLITTTAPTMPDTIFILDLNQGGVTISTNGTPVANKFKFIKQLDKSTPLLIQKVIQATNLTKAIIEFPQSPGVSPYQTIELRNAFATSIEYQSILRSDGKYAHLEIIEMAYQKIEVKSLLSMGACYCWDFMMNQSCTCN